MNDPTQAPPPAESGGSSIGDMLLGVTKAVGYGLTNLIGEVRARRQAHADALAEYAMQDPTLVEIPAFQKALKQYGFDDDSIKALRARHSVAGLVETLAQTVGVPTTMPQIDPYEARAIERTQQGAGGLSPEAFDAVLGAVQQRPMVPRPRAQILADVYEAAPLDMELKAGGEKGQPGISIKKSAPKGQGAKFTMQKDQTALMAQFVEASDLARAQGLDPVFSMRAIAGGLLKDAQAKGLVAPDLLVKMATVTDRAAAQAYMGQADQLARRNVDLATAGPIAAARESGGRAVTTGGTVPGTPAFPMPSPTWPSGIPRMDGSAATGRSGNAGIDALRSNFGVDTGGAPAAPAKGTTRAHRNNNPGNIKASDVTKAYPGVVGIDPDPAADGGNFLRFDSPDSGFAAMRQLLYSSGYKDLTVDAALKRWSNNGYGGEVAQRIGIDPTRTMRTLSLDEIDALTASMAHAEGFGASGGQPATDPAAPAVEPGGVLVNGQPVYPKSDDEWQTLLAKNPGNAELQAAYLRRVAAAADEKEALTDATITAKEKALYRKSIGEVGKTLVYPQGHAQAGRPMPKTLKYGEALKAGGVVLSKEGEKNLPLIQQATDFYRNWPEAAKVLFQTESVAPFFQSAVYAAVEKLPGSARRPALAKALQLGVLPMPAVRRQGPDGQVRDFPLPNDAAGRKRAATLYAEAITKVEEIRNNFIIPLRSGLAERGNFAKSIVDSALKAGPSLWDDRETANARMRFLGGLLAASKIAQGIPLTNEEIATYQELDTMAEASGLKREFNLPDNLPAVLQQDLAPPPEPPAAPAGPVAPAPADVASPEIRDPELRQMLGLPPLPAAQP